MALHFGFLAVTLALLTVDCSSTDNTTTAKDGGVASNSATGGTGSGAQIVVTINPPTLTESFRAAGQSVSPPKLKIDLSFSQPITQSVYLKIAEDQAILDASAPVDQPQANDKGGYETWVNLDPNLAVGTYQGTLRFDLCRDANCQSRYNLAGNEIPYLVEVHPAIAITIAMNESPPSSPVTTSALLSLIPSGTTVRIEASEQVVYSPSSDCARADSVTQDGTTWKGTLFSEQDAGGCIFYVKATSVELPLAQADSDFTFKK